MLTMFYKHWPRFYERILHDMHHLGVAIVPALCDRLLWVALLTVAIFLLLAALQTVIMGGTLE